MTIAISEILKQVALLSLEEQRELATKVMEQAQQKAANGSPAKVAEAELPAQFDAAEDNEDWLDVFSLNHVPPKDSYTVMMKFVDGGRGEPARYDFSDIFDDEEEESEN